MSTTRLFVVFGVLAVLGGCVRPPRERVSSEVDRGYPSCAHDVLPPGELVASRALRAGSSMPERSVVERFEIRRHECVEIFRGRQDWAMSSNDIDVVYDAETLLPLRAWKRVRSPGGRNGERVEVRRFELRDTERVALTQRTVTGEIEHWRLRGQMPRAVIGPGRGLLSMWIRRARLAPGGRLRESVLDMRESMELVRDVTLLRLDDRDDPLLGRVRVYSIYGREPFYADEDDIVVGDLRGLVRAELVTEPMPVPSVPESAPDPAQAF